MKKYRMQIIGLLVSVAGLYFVFRNVDFANVLSNLSMFNILLLACSVALFMATFWIRSWRWKYLFRKEHGATLKALTVVNLIGFAGNSVLPFRFGELVRIYLARKKTTAPVSFIVATLFIERILDTLSLILCLIIPSFFDSTLASLALLDSFLYVIFAIGVLVCIVIYFKPALVPAYLLPILRRLLSAGIYEKIEYMAGQFTLGLTELRNGGNIWKILLLSLLHWYTMAYSYQVVFASASLNNLPWTAPYLTLGIVGIGTALPSAPSFIGTFHASMVFALNGVFGVAKSVAVSIALVMHLLFNGVLICSGLIAILGTNLSLDELKRDKLKD